MEYIKIGEHLKEEGIMQPFSSENTPKYNGL